MRRLVTPVNISVLVLVNYSVKMLPVYSKFWHFIKLFSTASKCQNIAQTGCILTYYELI